MGEYPVPMTKSFLTTETVEEMVGIDDTTTAPTIGDYQAVGSENDGK